ncbi:MAG: MATE family efflux transporter [Geminicoccaceae bacterium]
MKAALPISPGVDLSIRDHVIRTLRLAGPVMLARAGLLVMVTVDTVMCGWIGTDQLAFYGIATVPQIALLLVGVGLLMGTVVVTAQLDGAGRAEDCGRVFWLSLLHAAIVGVLFSLLLLPGPGVLQALGQNAEITAGGGQAVIMFAYGMPAILLFTAASAFLEGISRPLAGMVVMLLANLLNVALNYLLMFDPYQLGAGGAALATSIVRWMMAVVLIGYVLVMSGGQRYGIRARITGAWRARIIGAWPLQRRLISLGWPMGLSFALEHGAFFAAATFAGWLGATALAAYQIVLNTMAVIYMLAIGIAVATGVRVGNAVGRGDRLGVARAGWIGVAIAVVVMIALMPLLSFGSGFITTIYTGDAAVIRLATTGLLIAAWILVVDASQGVLVGALRGAADIWPTLIIQVGSFWVLAIPLCYFFSFYAKYHIYGLLFGLFFGLTAACLFLGWRFVVLTRRDIRPAS